MPIFDTIYALLQALDSGALGKGDAVAVPNRMLAALSRYDRARLLEDLRESRVELRVGAT